MKLLGFYLTLSLVVTTTVALSIPPDFLISRSTTCADSNSCTTVFRRATKLARAKEIFDKLKKHIFDGEDGNSKSGRHMLTAWCAANKKSHGKCNSESKLCRFDDDKKTVWDDRGNNGYTKARVEALCTQAILHNIKDGPARRTEAFFVQTHLGRPICVEHAVHNQHSCYPKGVNFREPKDRHKKMGDVCSHGTGDTVATYPDKAQEKDVNCLHI